MAATPASPSGANTRRRRADRPRTEIDAAAIPASEIARRAYELFTERGGIHGHDVDDWLAAEIDLLRKRQPQH